MNVIENIKRIRQEKNITQADISEKLNLAQNNYGKIERGITELTIARLYEIAKVLEVSANELLGEPIQATDNASIKVLEKRVAELEEVTELQKQLLEEKNQKLDKAYNTFDVYIFWVFMRVGGFMAWDKVFGDKDKNGVLPINMTDDELEKFVAKDLYNHLLDERDTFLDSIIKQWNGDKRLATFYNRHMINIEEERTRIRQEKKGLSV